MKNTLIKTMVSSLALLSAIGVVYAAPMSYQSVYVDFSIGAIGGVAKPIVLTGAKVNHQSMAAVGATYTSTSSQDGQLGLYTNDFAGPISVAPGNHYTNSDKPLFKIAALNSNPTGTVNFTVPVAVGKETKTVNMTMELNNGEVATLTPTQSGSAKITCQSFEKSQTGNIVKVSFECGEQ